MLASLAGLMLAAALIVAPGASTPAHASEAGTIHSLLNQARGGSGLGPLARNGALDQVALNWANQMAAEGRLYHNPSYSAQIPGGWSRAAENIAQGYPTGASMHDGWWNSPGHRANMLGDFTDVGIAFIQAGGTTWGVQVFAKYGSSVPAPAPPPPPAPAEPAPAPEPEPDTATAMPAMEPRPTPEARVVDDATASIRMSNTAALSATELPPAVGAAAGMLGAGLIGLLAVAGSFFPRKGAENRRTRGRLWSRNGNGSP